MREHDGDGTADRVLNIGSPQRAGSFRFYIHTQRWEWSAEVARMHGYEPDEVEPTTELLLGHKHPDDRAEVLAALERLSGDGTPFSSRHRIIDTLGNEREMLVVGDQLLDEDGTVVGTTGYYVDLTDSYRNAIQSSVSTALSGIIEARAVIEQIKGMMMVVYGITEEQAFDVLQWRSQVTNTKLRSLAAQLRADVVGGLPADAELRHTFDHLLLTAHERVEQEVT